MTATPVIGNTFFGLDVSGLSGGFASIRRRISRSTLLIELAPRMLQIAEARQRSRGLEIRHFSRVPLPDGALERSVPTDPEAMAQLLRDLCLEKGIVSHRAAVVLPPELAFQRLVQLPKGLSVKEARDYLLDPTNGVTLPFPLAQTDFDLVPIEAFKPAEKDPGLTTFQLTAIPVSLVDPVLSMLDLAGFDLQGLELGSLSSLHLIKDGLLQLGDAGASLLLEFLPDATLVNLVCAEGLIDSDRLPAIREFPRYELSELEREQILNRSQSLEQVTVENERYLPLSEMDLRAFFHDLEGGLKNWSQRFPSLILDQVYVVGDGSAHPGLAELLQNNLNCSVKHVRPFLVGGLRDWSLDEPLLQSSLTRLVGLGMGLLGLEQAEDQSQPTPVVGSEVLTSMSSAKGFVEAEPDSQSSDSQQVLTNDHHPDGVRPVLADPESVNEPIDVEEESEWPSLKLAVSEVVIDEEERVADEVENQVAGVEVSGSVEEESEWPSLKLDENLQVSSPSESAQNPVSESNVIPGLSSSIDLHNSPAAKAHEEQGDKKVMDEASNDCSPLGELRFNTD